MLYSLRRTPLPFLIALACAIADPSLGTAAPTSAAPVAALEIRTSPSAGEAKATEPCVPSATVLCARQGRFRVAVEWHDFAGQIGVGTLVRQSSDSGLFWFFSEANWELVAKVLDGCSLNGRYWVFSAATTNVEYTLRVTDTSNGKQWSYHNPAGTPAPAVTDTSALDSCP